MLKFPKIKLDLYDLASFPGRRFRSPSCGEGPLWALSGPWRFDSEGQLSR